MPASRQEASLREQQTQRTAPCIQLALFKRRLKQNPLTQQIVSGVLRWVCDKRSQGWRSARIETGSLAEGTTDSAQAARHTSTLNALLMNVLLSKPSVCPALNHPSLLDYLPYLYMCLEESTLNNSSSTFPQAETIEQIRQNLATVRERIDQACLAAGRDPQEVRLLPVSKTHSADYLRLAYAAGCRMLGENKVQEAYQKWQELEDLTDLEWSVIGHLQTNKARYVARFASEFHALDSLRLAQVLNQRLDIEDRHLDVLVQINTSGEKSKFGITPEEAPELIAQLAQFPRLRVRGLMTLAIHSTDQTAVRKCFVMLRELRDSLQSTAPEGMQLTELSMGMSGDFELAIAEGATIVRIGQAIFGAREQPDSFYWPK